MGTEDLKRLARRVGHSLGLTKKKARMMSKILYEDGAVSRKAYAEGDEIWMPGTTLWVNNMPIITPGYYIQEPDEYRITFKGKPASFELDDEGLFGAFDKGDRVRIGYRELYDVTRDYVSPDFGKRAEVESVFTGYRFVSAQKLGGK